MKAREQILITGAASGIGRATARLFASEGVALVLVDRDADPLAEVVAETEQLGASVRAVVQDLSELQALPEMWSKIEADAGPIDILINNAGLMSFTAVEDENLGTLETLFRVNVLAPLTLCKVAVASFRERDRGQIVNVGSIFGSIAFAYFASYSATKFAIRGYSEALRRELDGSGICVTYVAPRAARTGLASVFGDMADAVGMKMDEPEVVAARVHRAIRRRAADRYLGFPESLFVRINSLLPRLVDVALRKQNRDTRPFVLQAVGRSGAKP